MSTLKVTTLQTLTGVEVYTAKAWVNFNGTGTVAIRGSGNVSSITDNGTGNYTVNFTTAMPDANYAATFNNTFSDTNITSFSSQISTSTSAGCRIILKATNNVSVDSEIVTGSVFR